MTERRALRHPERVATDRERIDAVLDEALVAHVAFSIDGEVQVLPMLHSRIGDRLYLHGSSGGRLGLAARDGLQVAVGVTLTDALVLARSHFNHSINYRSVVVHGTARLVEEEAEKRRALDGLVDAVLAGRAGSSRPPTSKELAATAMLGMDLTDATIKVRTGGPIDEPEDLDLPYWAGVVPLVTSMGTPEASSDLAAGIALPDYLHG
jgi:uncharacterized protein